MKMTNKHATAAMLEINKPEILCINEVWRKHER
jgi:hypothetical protein